MLSHVDELGRTCHALKGSLLHSLGRADEGHDGSIGIGPRVDVEKAHARYSLDGVGDLLQDGGIASFGEVGDTFDDRLRHLLLTLTHWKTKSFSCSGLYRRLIARVGVSYDADTGVVGEHPANPLRHLG